MDILTDENTAFEVEDRRPELAFLPVGATELYTDPCVDQNGAYANREAV